MNRTIILSFLLLLNSGAILANTTLDSDINLTKNHPTIVDLQKEHSKLLKNLEQLKLKNKILETKYELTLLDKEKADYSNKIKYKYQLEELENDAKLAKIKAEKKTNELNVQKAEWELRTERLESEITILKIKKERASYLDKEAIYLDQPLKENGTLVISDRRIALNGVITAKMATEITHKINYFNNKDEKKPIFLVIDSSPGGSVMAGYLIIKAIQSSKAPIYVVLKSFAASMAAVIVSTAEHSFAYAHATILHHQPSMFQHGNHNLTEQKENYKHLEKWWRYLAQPIAEKMGLTLDEFQKEMYKHSSKGDWSEFALDAHKLKWVEHIITQIQETGILSDLDNKENTEKKKESTQSQVENKLPHLNPTDAYFLYNPDGYYK